MRQGSWRSRTPSKRSPSCGPGSVDVQARPPKHEADNDTMNTVSEQLWLIYDLFTFNFELGEIDISVPGRGAVIPPELFPRILYYVTQDDPRDEIGARYRARPRSKLGDDPSVYSNHVREIREASPVFTLKSCSLVSLYWANQCRKYMFMDKKLNILDFGAAQAFRYYAIQGSERLVPIYKLIGLISVTQNYGKDTSTKSFLDLVYIPKIAQKLRFLDIHGPVPPNFPPCKMDTPHWSLSNLTCISPAATGYFAVSLVSIEFPSFNHVIKYLKHFRASVGIHISSITWNDKAAISLPRPLPTKENRSRINAEARTCTDSFHVALHAATVYADSPIHAVIDRDQQWALLVLATLRDYYQELDSIENDPNSCTSYCFESCNSTSSDTSIFSLRTHKGPQYPYVTITFYCGTQLPVREGITNRRSPKPVRIVAVVLEIRAKPEPTPHSGIDFPDLQSLRKHLESSCAIRVVLFTFDCYTTLRSVLERNPSLRDVWPSVDCMYRFVCVTSWRDPFPGWGDTNWGNLEVDPLTLQHTGRYWDHNRNPMDDLLTRSR
ncbi:hypothetical protein BDY19DRAFT_967599 [Irpex rosettiformis]|uniref:Uncharacterized protein n=1 Tax=Irpex rosettiformis TaxID=378272 RepID=A0ACB8TT53_9APHY|nr:hypothetical protein BDY19DRAFT_967599 [Irpex rosettiformis]